MKSAVHQYEDKLLEFAYGELARHEADAVEAHVRGCTRCAQALDEIRGVRVTMAQLPMLAVPDAGLDSLLAYADQAAKRNSTSAAKPSVWRRFLAPLVTVMALVTVGVIGLRANDEFDTSPSSAAADTKLAEMEGAKERRETKDTAPPALVAQAQTPPVAAVAAEPQPQPHPAPPADELAANTPDVDLPAALGSPKGEAEKPAAYSEVANNKKGGKAIQAGLTPQSLTRRNSPQPIGKAEDDSQGLLGDTNDVTPAEGKKAPPPPPPPAKTARIADQQKNEAVAGKDGALKQDWGNARGSYVQNKDSVRDDLATSDKKAPTKAPAKPTAKPQMAPRLPEEPSDGWSDKTAARQKETKPELAKAPAPSAPPQGVTFGLNNGDTSTGGSSPNANQGPAPIELAAKAKQEEKFKAESRRDEELRRSAAEKKVTDVEPQAEAQYRPAPSTVAPAPVATPEKKKSKSDSMALPSVGSSSSSPGRTAQPSSRDDDSLAVQSSERERPDNEDARKLQQQSREMAVDLIEQARVASGRGDRGAEIQLANRALQLGATGYTRVEALKRLCDALDALGEAAKADQFCSQLLREFPNTAAAQAVAQKRNAQRSSPPKAKKSAPAPADRKAYEFDETKEPKPAEAAPAQSY